MNYKKIIIGILALAVFSFGAFSFYTPEKERETTDDIGGYDLKGNYYPPAPGLTGYASMYRSALFRNLITQHKIKAQGNDLNISIDYLKKFDLEPPDSPRFKNDPKWSIFYNSDGKAFKYYDEMASDIASGKYVVTLSNRLTGLKTEAPELLTILPVNELICHAIIKEAKNLKSPSVVEIPTVNNINLLPYYETVEEAQIVSLPSFDWPIGCVRSDDKYYFYQVIMSF